jgi:hypothetical protein
VPVRVYAVHQGRSSNVQLSRGHVADFPAPGVASSIEAFIVAPAAIGEVGFVAWLLVKGVKVPERGELVPAVA